MQIASFLAHYQLVYINFDLSSFFLISCKASKHHLGCYQALVGRQAGVSYRTGGDSHLSKGHLDDGEQAVVLSLL